MNIIADMHTHTIASTHAYSTLQEMAHAAAQKGLYAMAVTDHGYAMPGAPGEWYFMNLKVLPRYIDGVLILRGEETNVTDMDGGTDLVKKEYGSLEWVVASMHDRPLANCKISEEAVTRAWLSIARNPKVNVIGHSGSEQFKYDYEKVIPEFKRNGKLVELNEGTFYCRRDSIPNCVKIMLICKKLRVPIIVNSDAHFSSRVGDFKNSLNLLKEIDFPEELVVNSSVVRLQSYLRQRAIEF
jgi:putative hydrolase